MADGQDPAQTQPIEIAFGDTTIAFGDTLIGFGAPLSSIPSAILPRLYPEQVVVAACRSVRIPASPVYQKGDPILPSVVFASSGVLEQEGFQKKITEQTIEIMVRAAGYGECVESAWSVYSALRKFPGNRIRSVTGFTDVFDVELDYYERTFFVQISR